LCNQLRRHLENETGYIPSDITETSIAGNSVLQDIIVQGPEGPGKANIQLTFFNSLICTVYFKICRLNNIMDFN